MGHRAKATCSSPTGCQRWLLFATVTLWLQVLGAPGLLQEGCGVVGGGPCTLPGVRMHAFHLCCRFPQWQREAVEVWRGISEAGASL